MITHRSVSKGPIASSLQSFFRVIASEAKQSFNTVAQSTIEFTFAMIVILFLIYGMVQVFRWAGMDLAQRRYFQDSSMTTLPGTGDPASQLNADDDLVQPMAAVYHGSITGNTGQ